MYYSLSSCQSDEPLNSGFQFSTSEPTFDPHPSDPLSYNSGGPYGNDLSRQQIRVQSNDFLNHMLRNQESSNSGQNMFNRSSQGLTGFDYLLSNPPTNGHFSKQESKMSQGYPDFSAASSSNPLASHQAALSQKISFHAQNQVAIGATQQLYGHLVAGQRPSGPSDILSARFNHLCKAAEEEGAKRQITEIQLDSLNKGSGLWKKMFHNNGSNQMPCYSMASTSSSQGVVDALRHKQSEQYSNLLSINATKNLYGNAINNFPQSRHNAVPDIFTLRHLHLKNEGYKQHHEIMRTEHQISQITSQQSYNQGGGLWSNDGKVYRQL